MRIRALAIVLVAALHVPAQEPEPHIDISGEWRMTTRDDPDFARPDLDDRTWTTVRAPFQPSRPTGYWWLRRTLQLPVWADSSSGLVLTVGALNEVYEVFVNGHRIASVGGPQLSQSFVARPRSFAIPREAADRTLTIALRLWTPGLTWARSRNVNAAFPDSGPWLLTGTSNAPRAVAVESLTSRSLASAAGLLRAGILGVLASLLVLAGWLANTARRDLLFVAGVLVSEMYLAGNSWFALRVDAPHSADMVAGVGLSLSPLLLAHFLRANLSVRFAWLLAPMWIMFLSHLGINGWAIWTDDTFQARGSYALVTYSTIAACAALTAAAAMTAWKAVRASDWNRAVTAVLVAGLAALQMTFLPGRGRWTLAVAGLEWTAYHILTILFALVLTVHLIRTLGASQQRLDQELQAARIVQQLLLANPGYANIDAAYLPAQEVGGDFWQSVPLADGGLLLVVGDVSGKGLKAAMVVALVIGAIRATAAELSPSHLLKELNRVLLLGAAGGFVTCCATKFAPDGTATVANAGHCPPYLDGGELNTPPALPLGICADASWDEVSLRYRSTLTFVSDGVVEAANAQGELFGFSRTAEISVRPARDIADVARSWGQNDDITVVTVRKAAA